MAKINIQPDCGNAPKKLFLKNLHVALANGDNGFFTKNIPDSITWEIIGHAQITGKDNFSKAIMAHPLWKVNELSIDTIITHGPDASVSGQVKTADNSLFTFCNIYQFKSAGGTTIKSIRTFML